MGAAEVEPALDAFVIHSDALLQDSLLYIDLLGREISRDNACLAAEYHKLGRKRSQSSRELLMRLPRKENLSRKLSQENGDKPR